jgi:glycosyltransferase involved in cell wall biosynthesis
MPVFNGADFVEDAVVSLLAQTETNFHLLISDDGSTDATPDICDRFAKADSRVQLVRQPVHLGITANFRFVRDETSSPFFMWAAQDDMWSPDFIATGLALLRRNPDAIGFVPAIEFVSAAGEELARFEQPAGLSSRDPATRARAVARRGFHAVYALFRREALAFGVEIEDVAAPDAAFVFGMALHGRFAISPLVLSTRRVIGYDLTPDGKGRPVSEKSLGPSGVVYSQSSREVAGLMFSYTNRAAIPESKKLLLAGHVAYAWWWRRWRQHRLKGNAWRLRRAMSEHRYVFAFGLGIVQAVLDPASVARRFRRRGDGPAS